MSKAISVSTGPIVMMFSPNGRYLREFSPSGPVFPIPEGTLPWQPILWQNYLHLLLWHYDTELDIATSMCACKNFENFSPVTPEKTGLICELLVRHFGKMS